ncbi:MAG: bifunctional enoyl-CoA hydratase/phosphate acetyltransferase [Deltaproteobacteria bacterium]|nr:bifunctional enoyl-CoA hydratase/phosphate acetyltransferase [Deltaproteobacteria bacterium]
MVRDFKMLIKEAASRGPRKVAVILPHETTSIEAINDAQVEGLAEGILIGQSSLMESLLKDLKIPLKRFEIYNEKDADRAAEYGVQLAASDAVDILLKGSISTNKLLGAALRGSRNLRTGNLMSDVFIFEDNREGRQSITLASDGGVNVAPDLKAKIGIIKNAVTVAHALGIKVPKVAILSGVEKVQPEVQSTVDALALAKICSYGEIPDCIVDGPFALDNAISMEAAKIKKVESPVAGSADILIMPGLEAGNIFGKALVYYGGKNLAHVIVGAKVPILISSRSDPPEARLASIALGVLLCSSGRQPA